LIICGAFSCPFYKPSGGFAFHLKPTIKKICILATKPVSRWALVCDELRNQPLFYANIFAIAASRINYCVAAICDLVLTSFAIGKPVHYGSGADTASRGHEI